MAGIDEKAEALVAKHPNLTKPEAMKILTEKNARKKKKRSEKAERSLSKKLKNEANRPSRD